jgi:hypothetical protein
MKKIVVSIGIFSAFLLQAETLQELIDKPQNFNEAKFKEALSKEVKNFVQFKAAEAKIVKLAQQLATTCPTRAVGGVPGARPAGATPTGAAGGPPPPPPLQGATPTGRAGGPPPPPPLAPRVKTLEEQEKEIRDSLNKIKADAKKAFDIVIKPYKDYLERVKGGSYGDYLLIGNKKEYEVLKKTYEEIRKSLTSIENIQDSSKKKELQGLFWEIENQVWSLLSDAPSSLNVVIKDIKTTLTQKKVASVLQDNVNKQLGEILIPAKIKEKSAGRSTPTPPIVVQETLKEQQEKDRAVIGVLTSWKALLNDSQKPIVNIKNSAAFSQKLIKLATKKGKTTKADVVVFAKEFLGGDSPTDEQKQKALAELQKPEADFLRDNANK